MLQIAFVLVIVAQKTSRRFGQVGHGSRFPSTGVMQPLGAAFIRTKKLMTSLFIALGTIVSSHCAVAAPAVLGSNECELSVGWNIIRNSSTNPQNQFISELVLTNTGGRTLGSRGWQLYFNFCRKIIPATVGGAVRVVHVNGDLFRLEPRRGFTPLQTGASCTIRFQTDSWVIKESDAPSGCYLIVEDDVGSGETIVAIDHVTVGPIVTKQQTMRTPNDQVIIPTSRSRYRENLALEHSDDQKFASIVPSPVVLRVRQETMMLDCDTVIHAPEQLQSEAEYLANALAPLLGVKLRISEEKARSARTISLSVSDLSVDGEEKFSGDHAYRLSAREDKGIAIVGTDVAGVFYGIQSLRSLLPIDSYRQPSDMVSFPAVEIEDVPRFGYRGLHLDVARNFQTPGTVKKILELMACYKLNKLHFHLTDDEGWRLEIAGLPELTDVGGRRSHSGDAEQSLLPSFGSGPNADAEGCYGSGFYSREEYIDILRYAAERHIEVMPEIDLPGHARAAIRAMEVRHQRLLDEGFDEEARQYLLHDPNDQSTYESVQMWNDNVIDICQDSSYAFIRHVISDIKSIYADAGLELTSMHLGGDEVPQGVWEKSPACQQLNAAADSDQVTVKKEAMGRFFVDVSSFLEAEGIKTAAWEEVFLSEREEERTSHDKSRNRFKGPKFQCYVWNNVWGWGQEDVAYRLANAGVNVVLCNATHLYFDLAYNKGPREPGYYWAGFVNTQTPYSFAPMNYLAFARKDLFGQEISQDAIAQRVKLTEEGKNHIIGIQGQLWGENLKGRKSLEYMALPKMIALAERAWAKQPEWASDRNPETWPLKLQGAWRDFAIQLGTRELPRLDYLQGGFHYRIPEVGAVIEDGVLKANIAFPGLTIRYNKDGSDPDIHSQVYTQPVRVGSMACVRAFASNGRGGRSCTIREQIDSQAN